MKKRQFIDKKQRNILIGLFFAVVLSISFLSWNLIKKGNSIIETEVQNYLSEISQQTSSKVNQRVNDSLSELVLLSKILTHSDINMLHDVVSDTLEESAFSWIGFVDTDGILHVQDHEDKDVSTIKAVTQALNGESGVSEQVEQIYDEEKGTLYVVPFLHNNENTAIVGWISPEIMKHLLNSDAFSSTGFSHIISKNGDFILKSTNKNVSFTDADNFFDAFAKSAEMISADTLEKVKTSINNKEKGSIEYKVKNDTYRTLTYIPLDKGDWYLLTIVPTNLYAQNILDYMNSSLITLGISTGLLFILVIILILRITYKKNKEITDIAYVDPVTSGFTQVRFDMECKKHLKDFKPFTVVSLDLRKFKLINDSFGAHEGNKVLKYVYECIMKNLNENEFAARINADNFNIMLRTTDPHEIEARLNQISKLINEYDIQSNTPYYLPIVCGSYIVKDHAQDLVAIRDKANIARKNNKNAMSHYLCSNVFYNDMEHLQMMKEKEMENRMEKALEENEFIIYLQPKVSLKSGKIIGSEALVRWNSKSNGIIPPNDFIPFFEKNNFIIKLDLYVFEKVCQTLRRWKDEGKKILPISINLSRNHLHNPGFLKDYKEIQNKYDIPSNLIEIELTETVVFENLELLRKIIDEIHECGYQCSMDDFGSGYSSLNVLKEIPVDILKLDKVFFNGEYNQRSADIVDSVIELAKKLGMKTIAEGIEKIPQVEILKHMDCDMIQGFVFSKPVPIKEFEDTVANDPTLLNMK